MKAQVFSLKSQVALRRAIARSLRTFYEDIEIEHRVYDDDDNPKKIGESYLQLLRASTIGVGAFTVEVEDQYGGWDYWDYAAEVERAEHFLRLPHGAKEKVFPSVALLNRMMIVPQGLRDALDAPADFAFLFRPLNLQGVLYVDFEGKQTIPNAIEQLGAEIRAEIVGLARRHMAVNRIRTPDLEDLGYLLDVHVDYLEQLREEILRPLPRLTVAVTSGFARLNRVSTISLEFSNQSENPPGIVDVQIRAPWTGMEEPPIRYTERLAFSDAGDRRVVDIDVFARAAPYLPLEVLFQFEGVMDAVAFPFPLLVDVREA